MSDKKSGYEIRADLLKLANEVINSNNCQTSTKYFEDKLKAEQLTILAHNHLCTEICSGFSPEIYQIQANLIRAGLIVETNNFLDD